MSVFWPTNINLTVKFTDCWVNLIHITVFTSSKLTLSKAQLSKMQIKLICYMTRDCLNYIKYTLIKNKNNNFLHVSFHTKCRKPVDMYYTNMNYGEYRPNNHLIKVVTSQFRTKNSTCMS
jgi:hypothetical protein